MRIVLSLLIIALLSGLAFAQDNPSPIEKTQPGVNQLEQIKSEVGEMLFAPLLKDRAWAAYYVGKFGLKEQARSLLVAAKNSLDDAADTNKIVFHLALDSLIQLDIAIPAEELMPLYQYAPDAVMILLAKAPKENREALLRLTKQVDSNAEDKEYWLAACNLLAENKAKGFAAYLLNEMTIYATVSVSDESGGGGIGEGMGSSIGCGGSGVFIVPEDFPPISFYTLLDSPKAGRVVLAPGTHTIYFERQVFEPKKQNHLASLRSHIGWRKNDYIVDQLASLLNIKVDGFGFKNFHQRYITWKNLADYQLMIAAFKSKIASDYADLKNQLITEELLSAAESEALIPKIVLKVYDYRGNKKIKLPDISGEVKSLKEN